MATHGQLFSVQSMKCIVSKVFREDFVLIEAQKRTGLLTSVKYGDLTDVLQNEEVTKAFQENRHEEMFQLIQTKIEESSNKKFSLNKIKKQHMLSIIEELNSDQNPFPASSIHKNPLTDVSWRQKLIAEMSKPPKKRKRKQKSCGENKIDIKDNCSTIDVTGGNASRSKLQEDQIVSFFQSMENLLNENPDLLSLKEFPDCNRLSFLECNLNCLVKFFPIKDIESAIHEIKVISTNSDFLSSNTADTNYSNNDDNAVATTSSTPPSYPLMNTRRSGSSVCRCSINSFTVITRN
jgi:hypothetical protein